MCCATRYIYVSSTRTIGMEHEPLDGMRVDVYRNLDTGGLSVMNRETDSDDYGTVVANIDEIVIDDPSFVVQQAGRQRVLDEQRKNVHAFVRGCVDCETVVNDAESVAVTYDPYQMAQFQTVEDGCVIESADVARVTPGGVVAEVSA